MMRTAAGIKPGFVHIRAFSPARHPPRKRGIQYAAAYRSIISVSGILGRPVKPADDTGIVAELSAINRRSVPASRLLLHILDAGECDALGALAGIAEIEFILGQEHRIAVDIVGDAGTIGGDEDVELLAVVG
jgi:hypothetical protein